MSRTDENEFEKMKLTKASTNKVACNVYLDSFGINKVKIQNFEYDSKKSIECYLDFEELALIANDCMTGKLMKELDNGQKVLGMKGSASSKNYDGAPESRVLSIGKSGDKIFINMTRGKGKLGDKGQIMPDGQPDLKIGVPVTIDKFRSMMIYSYDCVKAYLAHSINQTYKEVNEARLKASTNKTE